MAEEILEGLVSMGDNGTISGQLETNTSREMKCDYCGTVIVGTPHRNDALFGDYCNRDCFLLDFNRDNIFP